jgi:hypothetical protein
MHGLRDVQCQHALRVFGTDVLTIRIGRELEAARERHVEALAHQRLLLLLGLFLPLAGDGERVVP